ncbi:MAG: peptidoglycan-binding protein [Christensenellales bacterium]|jgi:peptidoglycan hydrolase-like protein with peptidoglycan-binding domain
MKKRWLRFSLSIILVLVLFPLNCFALERYEILKIGDKDEYVFTLQNKLKELDYFSVKATGYFGTVTQQAVINYQSDHSLTVDGKAGPETMRSIMGASYQIPSYRFTGEENSADTYYPGDKGDMIAKIQKRLKELEYYDYSSITGYYGPVTEQAIKRFQCTNGLKTDGIAGPKTMALLFSDTAKYFCIYPGDRGNDVLALQTRLKKLGYYTYNTVTGFFGTVTEHALKEFQAQNGLTIDAKAGKNTRAFLYANNAPVWDGTDRIADKNEVKFSKPVSPIDKMLGFAKDQLGKKYIYSTEGPTTFDCSGLVYFVLKYMGVSTSRFSAAGFSNVDSWEKITEQRSLQPGDILFFKSDTSLRISHTGIYIGSSEFVHASSSDGCVKISSFTNYYNRNFVLARRLVFS